MMITIFPRWRIGDADLDPRLLPLLRAIAASGSLSRAVAALRLSYRHAWGLLGKGEKVLGGALVAMERGRGAQLSPFAEQLLQADETAAALLAREMAPTLEALRATGPGAHRHAKATPLVIHASHDFALAELKEMLADRGVPIDLHFRGSLESLASLARRECDVAGFHLPETANHAALAPYRPALAIRGLALVRFVRRRQGLMVKRGNPKRLKSVAHLARAGVRFVNRQPESGTRLCFDRLLADARLRPDQISGYQIEEFTHAAVAATVASGMADAGFGIEAAARRHKLDFVPLAVEDYYLAARSAILVRTQPQAMLSLLRSEEFRKRVEALPGYEPAGMGEIVTPRNLLQRAA